MMRLLLPLFAAVLLSGCAGLGGFVSGLPASPGEVADQTTLDERGAIAVEIAYQAAARAAEALTDAGLIEGADAVRVAELDQKAFAAVQTARRAYAAGNAASYAEAIGKARADIGALLRQIN